MQMGYSTLWRCFYGDVSIVIFHGYVPLVITSFIIRVGKGISDEEIFNWNLFNCRIKQSESHTIQRDISSETSSISFK